MPPTYNMRLLGLRSIDQRTIRVFLNFSALPGQALWHILDEEDPSPPHLCLLAQEQSAPSPLPSLTHIAWVLPGSAPAHHSKPLVLRQPLQLDEFRALLRQVESLPLSAPALALQPNSAGQPQHPAPLFDTHRSHRLSRWPGAQLLSASAYLPRLASLLTARALTLNELVLLSRRSRAECVDFLNTLQQQCLLQEHTGAPPAPEAPAALAQQPASAACTPQRTQQRSLIAQLRRHLKLI